MDIRKVAVIGGGPAGLAAVYELLHTTEDGKSTVGGAPASNPKFEVVAFEQRDVVGGTWAPSFEDRGIEVPPQDILDTENYHVVTTLEPSWEPPVDISGSLVKNPVQTDHDIRARQLQWRQSGIYKDLYTNIPARFTRFSYMENDAKYLDPHRVIYPFLSQIELCNRIEKFIAANELDKYYRLNTRVELVTKKDSKWKVVLRKSVDGDHDEWYEETFDGVIIAIGQFSIPNMPQFPGLAEFNKNFPGRVLHVKAFREYEEFADQSVLIIGASVSTVNLLQYIVPIAKSVTVSSRGDQTVLKWINDAVKSEGIINKSVIESINGQTGEVTFTDGTKEPVYDKIIYATGYQRNVPFVKDILTIDPKVQAGKVNGLYYNTFAIDDPTLAAVGVTSSLMNFFCMEASAAAIAGVWSNIGKLPPKEEQKKWETDREAEKGIKSSFHAFDYHDVLEGYVKPLSEFFPEDRYNPVAHVQDHIGDIDVGIENLEKLFYKVKSGEIKVADTVNL